MLSQLKAFESAAPEIVFHWQDPETPAQGWLVINSLRNGAAGGGTRMRKGLTQNEVVSLAKTMEVKFNVSGPPIGGAKSGIDFDPENPRKEGVLKRWYAAIRPLLKAYYGTGGDLNVDEVADVMPITTELGILHPQEGVMQGYLSPDEATTQQVIQQLTEGVKKRVTHWEYAPTTDAKHISISDMVTGFGVAMGVKHFYDIWNLHGERRRVIVQGFGNVGGAAALTLAKEGYEIVGIIDRRGGILAPEGLKLDDVKHLYLNRDKNHLPLDGIIPFEEINQRIWSMGAEVFIPAAGSRLVTAEQVDQMVEGGLEVISCGANVPFADPDIFLGPIGLMADQRVAIIPDFIANCGMARTFAYLMQPDVSLADEDIFEDISETIAAALRRTHSMQMDTIGIWQAALAWGLNDLMKVEVPA